MHSAEASTRHVKTLPRHELDDAPTRDHRSGGHHRRKSRTTSSPAYHDAADEVAPHQSGARRPDTARRRHSVNPGDGGLKGHRESHVVSRGRRRRKSHQHSSASPVIAERQESRSAHRRMRRGRSHVTEQDTQSKRLSLSADHEAQSKPGRRSRHSHHARSVPGTRRTVVSGAQDGPSTARELRSCLKKTSTNVPIATVSDGKNTSGRRRRKHHHHRQPPPGVHENEVDGPHEMRRSQREPSPERLALRIEKIQCASITVISAGNDVFMTRLYTQLLLFLQNTKAVAKKNFIFSPFSTNACLSHVLSVASGLTAAQIRRALALPDQNETLHRGYVNTMNGLRDSCIGSKTRMAYHIYRQEDPELSLGAPPVQLKEMNPWVSEQTQHALPVLINKNGLIVASVVHFTGLWAKRFPPSDTIKNARFVTPHMKEVPMDLMRIQDDFAQIDVEELRATALEIPYAHNHLSMIVLLPNDARGFLTMEEKICDPTFDFREAFRTSHFSRLRRMDVALPKFKLSLVHDFSGPLAKMGMDAVFDASTADLRVGHAGADNSGAHIGCVLQKTVFEVDEEGAELPPTRLRDPMIPRFSCHHAFMFFVKHRRTDLIFFAGRIVGEKNVIESSGTRRASGSSSNKK